MPSLVVIGQQMKEKQRGGTMCPLSLYRSKRPQPEQGQTWFPYSHQWSFAVVTKFEISSKPVNDYMQTRIKLQIVRLKLATPRL